MDASKKPFQFTLKTAVMLMFAAAILLYLNIHKFKFGIFADLLVATVISFRVHSKTKPDREPFTHYSSMAISIVTGTFAFLTAVAYLVRISHPS